MEVNSVSTTQVTKLLQEFEGEVKSCINDTEGMIADCENIISAYSNFMECNGAHVSGYPKDNQLMADGIFEKTCTIDRTFSTSVSIDVVSIASNIKNYLETALEEMDKLVNQITDGYSIMDSIYKCTLDVENGLSLSAKTIGSAIDMFKSIPNEYLLQKVLQFKMGFIDKNGNIEPGAISYSLNEIDSSKYTISFDPSKRLDNLYLRKGDINSHTYTNYFKDRKDGKLETIHYSDGMYVQKYDGEYKFNCGNLKEYNGEYLVFNNGDSGNAITTTFPLAKFDKNTGEWTYFSENEKKQYVEKATNYYSEVKKLQSNYSSKFKQEVIENVDTQTLFATNSKWAGLTTPGGNETNVTINVETNLSDWNINAYTHELAHGIDQNSKYSSNPTFIDVCNQIKDNYYDANDSTNRYNVYTVLDKNSGALKPNECWGRMVEGYFGTGKGSFSSDDLKSMEITVNGANTNAYDYLSTLLQ